MTAYGENLGDGQDLKKETAHMLGMAAARSLNIRQKYPEAVSDAFQIIEEDGVDWLRNPDDVRGVVLRAYIGDLVAMLQTVDGEQGETQ